MSKPITIQLDHSTFLPGSTVTGKIHWKVSAQNETLDLRLFWFTEGRGTQDVGLADEVSFDTRSNSQGEEEFTLQLPVSPVSFQGSLISLQWAVEAEAIEDHDSEKVDIIVSSTGKETELSQLDQPLTSKKKKHR